MKKPEFETELKIFMGLGVVVVIGLLVAVFTLAFLFRETARFQKCINRSPLDKGCEPGFAWRPIERFLNFAEKESD